MPFGEEVSGKFLAKWSTFFKLRIIADRKNRPQSAHVDELLLSAQQESDDGGKCILDKVNFTCLSPATPLKGAVFQVTGDNVALHGLFLV